VRATRCSASLWRAERLFWSKEIVRYDGRRLAFWRCQTPFDGLLALELAQQKCPDVPFVFVSGAIGEEIAVDMLKRGATDYVLKQRLNRLGPAVNRALSESRQRAERKRAEEELLRKARELTVLNADLEQFAYAASHDLQEPLRTISIFSKLLATRYKEMLDEQATEYLKYIESAARHMGALLEDLLRYAKVPFPDREQEETDLLPPRVRISCAMKDGEWVLSVSDNGIGFDQAYSEQIFGLFKRLNRRGAEGTGLGLAICERIVEVHGGRIWAESKPGQGSTFYFSVPLRRSRNSETAGERPGPHKKRSPPPALEAKTAGG
jgi:signal transduction histidine kinase